MCVTLMKSEKWGKGEKEESFIEQGHQVGIKEDRRYAGLLTNFQKKTASALKKELIRPTH
jgi:hypothetical protein